MVKNASGYVVQDTEKLVSKYGCGPVQFSGTDEALYERHLLFDSGVDLPAATTRDRFEALARSVRDVLSQRWLLTEKTYEERNPKRLYYLSMEFLVGRSLANNVTNLLLAPLTDQFIDDKKLNLVRAIRTDELQDGLSTSIGVACLPESTPDPSMLVSQADKAMYASKEAGGNRVSRASASARPAANTQPGVPRALLTEVISELEDNLEYARAPRIGDAYRRPSSRVWKSSRNKIGLPDPLRSDVVQIYREIDDWLTVVESGVQPNMGSPALNNTTVSLAIRLPMVIAELKKFT